MTHGLFSTQINSTSTDGVSSTNGQASKAATSDISHLVRKKVRKLNVWSEQKVKTELHRSAEVTQQYSPIKWTCLFQRKPEESPVKEGDIKKVKQDAGQTNGVQEPHTNGVHKANGHT